MTTNDVAFIFDHPVFAVQQTNTLLAFKGRNHAISATNKTLVITSWILQPSLYVDIKHLIRGLGRAKCVCIDNNIYMRRKKGTKYFIGEYN